MKNIPSLPAKIKAKGLDQIDHALKALDCNELITIQLIPMLMDEHISLAVLMETLGQIEGVIPPLLASAKSRGFLGYSNCLGGTPPIAECGRTLL